MRILTFLLLMVVGAGQAMAIAESNPRVKFIYDSEHGTAFASGANGNGVVTITITPDENWCCFDGDVTAKVTANTNMAQAPRRTQPGVQLGDAIDVTCTATNVFTLTLPEDENLNATVTVSFREIGSLTVSNIVYTENADDEFTFTVSLGNNPINGTYGDMTFEDGVATVVLKGGESATATDLPTSLGYTVTKTDKDGYRFVEQTGNSGTISADNVAEAQFTYVQSTEVKVSAVWNDADNQDGYRPDDVTINLVADGNIIDTVVLSDENNWTYNWSGLDKYSDAPATAITYICSLANMPDNYVLMNDEISGNTKTITLGLQTVTLSSTSATYIAGTDQKPTVTVTVGGSVINQDDYTVSYKLNDQIVTEFVNSGTYTVSIADKEGGYNLRDVDVPFTINGAPVMVTVKNEQNEDVKVPAATGDATITLDQDGITLTLITPEASSEPHAVSIPKAVEVDHVDIQRTFIGGKASTLYLPFEMEVSKMSGGTFHTLTGVDETTTPWTVKYSEALDASFELQANTPYIFLPNGSNGGKMTVNNGKDKVSVSTANPHTTAQGVWEFIGTHSPIVWQGGHADLGRVFGFAAEEKNGCEIGQFVKAGAGASIDPMRGYLRYTASLAPAMDGSNTTAVDELPATMRVVIGGETTSLVSIDNGQLTIDNDVWYTLDGRKLDKQPTAKGVYINGGRKVVVK